MADEEIDEAEVWPAIRYLDLDEQETGQEATTATIIAILAILMICSGVWSCFG